MRLREVSLGNKGVVSSSSSSSFATTASSTPQDDISRLSSCKRAFATESGKTFNNLLQSNKYNVFSLENECAGSWLCHNAFTSCREDIFKDSKAGNAACAIDDPFG